MQSCDSGMCRVFRWDPELKGSCARVSRNEASSMFVFDVSAVRELIEKETKRMEQETKRKKKKMMMMKKR